MRTYYRSLDVVITGVAFVRRTEPAGIYLIRELHQVVMTRGEPDPARSATALAAGAGALMSIAAWHLLDTPGAYAAAAMIATVPAVAGITCWRLKPRTWELRATYEGHEVLLFSSSDAQTFHQVGRGLRRAIEDHGPAPSAYGLAGG